MKHYDFIGAHSRKEDNFEIYYTFIKIDDF